MPKYSPKAFWLIPVAVRNSFMVIVITSFQIDVISTFRLFIQRNQKGGLCVFGKTVFLESIGVDLCFMRNPNSLVLGGFVDFVKVSGIVAAVKNGQFFGCHLFDANIKNGGFDFIEFFFGHFYLSFLILNNEYTILTIPMQIKNIPNFNNIILTIGQF